MFWQWKKIRISKYISQSAKHTVGYTKTKKILYRRCFSFFFVNFATNYNIANCYVYQCSFLLLLVCCWSWHCPHTAPSAEDCLIIVCDIVYCLDVTWLKLFTVSLFACDVDLYTYMYRFCENNFKLLRKWMNDLKNVESPFFHVHVKKFDFLHMNKVECARDSFEKAEFGCFFLTNR